MGDGRGGTRALHGRRQEDHFSQRKPTFEHAQQVVNHRATLGRDDTDAPREARQRPFATRLKQPLGLELAVQLLTLHLRHTDAFWEQQVGHQLAGTLALVQMNRAVGDQRQAIGRHDRRVERAAAEQHTAQLRVLVLQREVVVPGRRAAHVDHFAAQPHVLQHGVRVEHAADVQRQLTDRVDVRRVLEGREAEQRLRAHWRAA